MPPAAAASDSPNRAAPRGPIDAADLGIVIPFRHDRPERLENLTTALRHLTATLAGAQIIVIEDGAQMQAQSVAARLGVAHVAQINAGAFHRTRILNHGIETLLQGRFAASYDTDALIYPQAWTAALTLLRGGAPVVFPYGGRFCDVRGAARARLLADPDLAQIPAATAQSAPEKAKGDLVCINPCSVGGVVLFDRATYTACGGYHEGFVGWGFEDAEIMARMAKLSHPHVRVPDIPLIHLAHPRGNMRAGFGFGGTGWYGASRRNNALFRRMGRLGPSQLAAYIAAGGLRGTAPPPAPVGLLSRLLGQRG